MKKFLVSLILIFSLVFHIFPQVPSPGPSPTPERTPIPMDKPILVEVPQQFVDDANKAFKEVVAQREVIEKFIAERRATEAEREAAKILLDATDKLIKLNEAVIQQTDKLMEMYIDFIDTQQKFIDKLIEINNSKKSTGFLSKVWNAFKTAATVLIAFYVGKGVAQNNFHDAFKHQVFVTDELFDKAA